MADRALEYPPRDIHKLSSAAAKFLLTDLEPALRLAQEIRQQSLVGPAPEVFVASERRDEAVTLLST